MTVCTLIDVHTLPEEVLLHVLFFLPPKDLLLNCATVSKYFQELAYNEQLWWHHVFKDNKHYRQEWLYNGQNNASITPITPLTPMTPSTRTPLSSASTSSSRIVWRKDRYVYHVGLDERFDRIYSFYDNENDTLILNPRHYYLESCLVQASCRENDHARDGENDMIPTKSFFKTNGGVTGFLERNKALESKIAKGMRTPGKRHRLTLTSVLTPVTNTPSTPTTPSSPTTPQSPVLWLNQMFTNAVNNIRGKAPINVNHRSICLIGGFSERIQSDSQRESCVHMFDCARQQFRTPVEQFVKNDKPPLYGKHSAVLFDEDESKGIQGRIFLFGGSDGNVVTDDLYIYDLDKSSFTKVETKGPKPAPRVNHCACRIGDHHMYVLGGGVGKDMVPSSEIWVLDTRTLTWELIEQCNDDVFTPRLGFTIVAVNDKILLHGGAYWIQNNTEARWREAYKQTMLFDTKTRWWSLLHTTGNAPEVGSFPTSCLIGTQWFFISGATESNVTDEIYCFDTVTYKWRHMKEKNYLADGLSCCPYTHYGPNRQQKILIFGGYRYAPLMSVSVLNVRWVDLMVKNGIMPLKQIDKGICMPGIATPVDGTSNENSNMFAYYY